jgi:hypothetical protein
MGLLLRLFAFLFNLALGAALFLLSLLVMASGRHNIHLPAVPLTGAALTYTLFGASLFAFVSMVLALRKSRGARVPMLLWNLAIPALLIWGVAQGTIEGRDTIITAAWLFGASLAALLGAWLQLRRGGGYRR